MSAKDAEEISRCASCGIDGGDEIKLKRCTACYLVRYCSVKCQKDHRPKHKKKCKKRAAELRDELLFKQPEGTDLGDCPICCLPMPNDPQNSTLSSCCSKSICDGCNYANKRRELEGKLQHKCPFCREAVPTTEKEANDKWMKRVEANDPVAIRYIGTGIYEEGDYKAAFEYFTKAAVLGDVEAHHRLYFLYREGEGVEKDEKRALHHLTDAAIGGHPDARHNLGLEELKNGRVERAAKHYIIAAKLGDDDSMESVKSLQEAGIVGKEDFAAALRGYQAAIDGTKSPQREEAAEYAMARVERDRKGT
jgi:tetratricopeptide (TPR) repeat protein